MALAIEHYETPPAPPAGVLVRDKGTIAVFTLLTDRARAWVDEHVEVLEASLTIEGFAADHRPAQRIVRAMTDAGLTVQIQRGRPHDERPCCPNHPERPAVDTLTSQGGYAARVCRECWEQG